MGNNESLAFTVTDVYPGCDYEISVRAKPAFGGLFGDKKVLLIRTTDDG